MIRFARHNKRDYVIVETYFKIEENDQIIQAPIHIRIDTTEISKDQNEIVFKKAALLFNRPLIIKKKEVSPKKWWNIFS
jgi:hypothetical protein